MKNNHKEDPRSDHQLKILPFLCRTTGEEGEKEEEKKPVLALFKKGCSRAWGEILCAGKRRQEGLEGLYFALRPHCAFTGWVLALIPSFQLWDGDPMVGVEEQVREGKRRKKRRQGRNGKRERRGEEFLLPERMTSLRSTARKWS